MVLGRLHQIIRSAYKKTVGLEPPRFVIEPSKRAIFGDFSTNIAMIASSETGKNAVILAQQIVHHLEQSDVFKNVSVATPGFINFSITDDYLLSVIKNIIKNPDSFGKSDLGKETRVLVEYISANPTGPLTVANGRGAFVGEAIARTLELYGCTVMREYYVNDRGGQIAALGRTVIGSGEPEYAGKYISGLKKRVKDKDPYSAGEQAAAIILEEMIKPSLKKIEIDFHQFFSERSLYQTGVFKQVKDNLKARGLLYEAEGATYLATSRFGDEKDRVVIKNNNEETYLASDIAYHSYKIQRGYHRLINVVGADHSSYTQTLTMLINAVMRDQFMWGGQLDWVVTQIVKLIQNGQELKMSKRSGTYVLLDEVIEEVGPDVARFFFLSKSVDSHLDFDMDLAKSNSSQNPVFYVQYAYARIASIFRQFSKEEEFVVPEKITLSHPLERQILLKIIQFPDLIEEIVGDLQVQKLVIYVQSLATIFHSFYEQLRIQGESTEVIQSRLAILKATSLTIKKALDVIGISAPSRMISTKDSKTAS